ncbi:MAG: uncharacterized protein A8A55_1761 [Amphiamblys sp. WSBS2006]|nr:MAG: uncharacterized protein A8A55_1761 [Amphiamblys sp. WSBS2006]
MGAGRESLRGSPQFYSAQPLDSPMSQGEANLLEKARKYGLSTAKTKRKRLRDAVERVEIYLKFKEARGQRVFPRSVVVAVLTYTPIDPHGLDREDTDRLREKGAYLLEGSEQGGV